MFNFLLKQPQKVENTTPSLQLIDGLNLINRVLLTTKQWNNQFAKIQQTHYPESNSQQENSHQLTQQSFTEKLTSQIQNINTKRCELCKKQQSLDEFKRLSKCDHKYCYSCLNNYAISKIQGHQRVKCPQLSCLFELKLSSQVYKCLPEKIKLKYLRWINEMKAKKIDLSNSCVRCLQLLHTGPCTVEYSRQNIESAFQFRKCFKCKSQIRLSSGQKRLQCQQCHSVFCYCCGQVWPLTGEHFCVNSEKIFLLQKQVGQSTVNEHHHEGCCQDSQIQCLRNCGNCIGSCFYCKRCDFNICLGNVVMIPIRLLGTVIVLTLYAILLIPVLIIILGWLFTGIITGVTCFTCEIIEKFSGCWQILAFLGYPILMLGGIGLGLVKTFPGFYEALQNVASFYGKALCELWIVCGPKQCCS